MTTRTASKNRAIVFLIAQLFFIFVLAVVFSPSAWAGEDLSTLRAKAEAGDPNAQFNLGLNFFLEAQLTLPNTMKVKVAHWYRLAAHWWRLAAKQGNAEAQLNLGVLYENGRGVPKDYRKAAHWYRLAAKQGKGAGQFLFGLLYYEGRGVPKDYGKAAHWYRLAAKQGEASSQTGLGWLYFNGQGVPKDYGKAAHWYRLAAKQGEASSQTGLGWLYFNGQGVPKDYGKAAHWYRLAAKQGEAYAQNNLGILYESGQGVPQNYARAYKWWILAKAAGSKLASKNLDLLMPKMTPDQIAEGQRLAEQWNPTKNGSALTAEARTNPFPGTPGSGPASPELSEIKKMLEIQNQEIANMRSKKEASAKPAPHYSSVVDQPDFQLPEHHNWYAVVVGVEQYPKGIPPAEFSERDAQAVKANLIALGYPESHIRMLTNDQATDARIKVALKNWLPRNVPQGGRVLFYFAGHGGTDSTSKTAYLVPFDGDPEDLPDTALSVGEIEKEIGTLSLSRGIIVADACFSGAGGRSVLPKGARPLTTVFRTPYPAPYANLTVFGASQGNQISGDLPKQGHGIFTYYFLRGLEGQAKTGNVVTPRSLKRYLSRRVPLAFRHHYDSGEQNPVASGDMNGVLVKY